MTNPNRTERILLRATPGEKAVIAERAAAHGLKLSAWIRQAAMQGTQPAVRPEAREPGYVAPEPGYTALPESADDLELQRLVERFARLMPRKTAERVARRELAKERA